MIKELRMTAGMAVCYLLGLEICGGYEDWRYGKCLYVFVTSIIDPLTHECFNPLKMSRL